MSEAKLAMWCDMLARKMDDLEKRVKALEERTLVNDDVCFSEACWWVSGRIRCRNCPYIDCQGNILDQRVGKRR
jgi:hypothetical protein